MIERLADTKRTRRLLNYEKRIRKKWAFLDTCFALRKEPHSASRNTVDDAQAENFMKQGLKSKKPNNGG